ncbi:MAG: MBOAT family O-acyltransferase [Thermoleophilia bacterium]
MTFTSPLFLVVLLLSVGLYWALPARHRWMALLTTGYLLYLSTGVAFFPVLLLVTLTTYAGGRALAAGARARGRALGTSAPRRLAHGTDAPPAESERPARRWLLAVTVFAGLAPLAVFKYTAFVTGSLAAAADALGAGAAATAWLSSLEGGSQSLLLPLGISFYTFKGVSYLIEVARDPTRVERSLGRYALSISFFPQIFAGPIERPHAFLAQLDDGRPFDRARASGGLGLLAAGLFKKLVVADRLAPIVNQVYGDLGAHTGLPLLVAVFGFSLQIYYDFAGYSDIANGVSRLFGFDGVENFRRPYFSRGFREFWHRWHISLSTWFRDYVYFPLGGSRVRWPRHAINLLVTFTVSGLWHGAAWTFVVWGAMHGILVIGEALVGRAAHNARAFARAQWGDRGRARRTTRVATRAAPPDSVRAGRRVARGAFVFTLVSVAWVFFRAPSLGDAVFVLSHLATGASEQMGSLHAFTSILSSVGLTAANGAVLVVSLGGLLAVEIVQETGRWPAFWSTRPGWQKQIAAYALVASILLVGSFERNSFIYFQF